MPHKNNKVQKIKTIGQNRTQIKQGALKSYDLIKLISQGYTAKIYTCQQKQLVIKQVKIYPLPTFPVWKQILNKLFCDYFNKSFIKQKQKGRIKFNEQKQPQKLKILKHNNIIQMYDYFYERNIIYIVLQKCDFNLRQYLFQDQYKNYDGLSQNTALLIIIQQILQGVKYLQTFRIYHMDIRPSHILIKQNEKKYEQIFKQITQQNGKIKEQYVKKQIFKKIIKIIDFSQSKIIQQDQIGQTLLKCSAFNFKAPEMLRSQRLQQYIFKKCDIWGLGITFFMFIFKTLPFDAQDTKQLLKTIQKKKNIFQKYKISNQIQNLIKCMLQVDYEKRINYDQLYNRVNNLVKERRKQFTQKQMEFFGRTEINQQIDKQFKKQFNNQFTFLEKAVQKNQVNNKSQDRQTNIQNPQNPQVKDIENDNNFFQINTERQLIGQPNVQA